jgi:hypothetical protein
VKGAEEWKLTFSGKRDLAGDPCVLPAECSSEWFSAEDLKIQKDMEQLVQSGYQAIIGIISTIIT